MSGCCCLVWGCPWDQRITGQGAMNNISNLEHLPSLGAPVWHQHTQMSFVHSWNWSTSGR